MNRPRPTERLIHLNIFLSEVYERGTFSVRNYIYERVKVSTSVRILPLWSGQWLFLHFTQFCCHFLMSKFDLNPWYSSPTRTSFRRVYLPRVTDLTSKASVAAERARTSNEVARGRRAINKTAALLRRGSFIPFLVSPARFRFDSPQALRAYFSPLPISQPVRITKEAFAEERGRAV